jgi:putative acetyltransferase
VHRRLRIVVDDLSGPEVAALLADHLASMHELTPAESVHALDLSGLRTPDVTFWSAWSGAELAGCGALKELDPTRGEVKSMRTAPAHLRRGVAAAVLTEIIATARDRGYDELLLETGPDPAFAAAHALYIRSGFVPCGRFADYADDPFSRFFRLDLGDRSGRG